MAVLNGEPALQYQLDLYRAMPTELSALRNIIHNGKINEKNSCMNVAIETVYREGLICFDPVNKSFTDFNEH